MSETHCFCSCNASLPLVVPHMLPFLPMMVCHHTTVACTMVARYPPSMQPFASPIPHLQSTSTHVRRMPSFLHVVANARACLQMQVALEPTCRWIQPPSATNPPPVDFPSEKQRRNAEGDSCRRLDSSGATRREGKTRSIRNRTKR